ncbi:MAG: hydantoinase/oxoprolinase family protein [Candidatus Altiarchaeota archaeon]
MVYSAGLDIGGVNFKGCCVEFNGWNDFTQTCSTHKVSMPSFFVTEFRRFLCEEGRGIDVLGVTSTAELTPVLFPRLSDGITSFAGKISEHFSGRVFWMGLSGELIENNDVIAKPYDVAAANWVASALLVGRLVEGDCILVDVGSTTTDVIPIVSGRPDASGRHDYERLASSELIYTGALYSNARLVDEVLVDGRRTRTANESFSSVADVHRILGNISDKEYVEYFGELYGYRDPDLAYTRLAHLVCADDTLLERDIIEDIARQIYDVQLNEISSALKTVYERKKGEYGKKPPVVVSGFGARFLAAKAAECAGFGDVVYLEDELGVDASVSTASYAMALFAAQEEATRA